MTVYYFLTEFKTMLYVEIVRGGGSVYKRIFISKLCIMLISLCEIKWKAIDINYSLIKYFSAFSNN
jgi:hypothetical protein